MAAPHAADRNLLFGILALQMDFITRDQLVAAMHAWVLAKAKALGEILVEQRTLRTEDRALLEPLVQRHIEQHGNDAERSLAALSSAGLVRAQLRQVADPDVQASVAHVGSARPPDDPWATKAGSVGQSTSQGTRFHILRPHARGGLGQVYVAHDEELRREVALKEIQLAHADNPTSRARFVLEAEVTGGLEHPGIVPVYGLGHYEDGRPFYAMRFINGRTLQDAIRRFHDPAHRPSDPILRDVELRKLLRRFFDVCNAIAYAHSRGVLHRDLKPGNIMLGEYDETLVVDWGLAKPQGTPAGAVKDPLLPSVSGEMPPTMLGSVIGTPEFMSPEQAAGRLDQLGPASDVYCLGATLYCLLTGQPPFTRGDDGDILARVQEGRFPRPRQFRPEVHPALEAIAVKAMALKPANRYSNAAALAKDIEHWLLDQPVSAWPEPWRVRARRWVSRHRTLVTASASAVAMALIGLAVVASLVASAREQRALRVDYLNREVRAALDQGSKQRQELHRILKDSRTVHELLSDIDQWHTMLQMAEQYSERARKLAESEHELVHHDVAVLLAEFEEGLASDRRDWNLAKEVDDILLEESTSVKGAIAYPGTTSKFPAAFARANIDVAQSDPGELARRISERPARYAIVAAMDRWAEMTDEAGLLSKLTDVARCADPHPWRDSYRQPAKHPPGALKQLARELRPEEQSPSMVINLALRLSAQGGDGGELLRRALPYHPRNFWLYFFLALAAKEPAEKEGRLQAALVLRPRSAVVHNNLGLILKDKQDLDGAITHFKKAVDLAPSASPSRFNLAAALADKNEFEGAITHYQKVVELDPDDAVAHFNLAAAFWYKRDLERTVAHYQKAANLGCKVAQAYWGIGNALYYKQDVEGAIACYKKALEADPKDAKAHNNLGALLCDVKRDYDGAIAHFNKSLELDPRDAACHSNLGIALRQQGRFAEAQAAAMQCLKLLPPKDPRRLRAQQAVQHCDRLIVLDRALTAYLAGQPAPPSAQEQLQIADLCQRYKKYHATAVQLFSAAFAAEPALLTDLKKALRYNAACSALLAAAGQARDPQPPNHHQRIQLRSQALTWLTADLMLMAKASGSRQIDDVLLVIERLSLLQKDADLECVRDPSALTQLPQEEQRAWQKLWADTNELRKQIRARTSESTLRWTLSERQPFHTHAVEMEAGKTYVFYMHSTALDSYLKLHDGGGKLLAENDDIAPDDRNARLIFTPTTSGSFRVVATSFEQRGRGTYTLTICAFGGKPK